MAVAVMSPLGPAPPRHSGTRAWQCQARGQPGVAPAAGSDQGCGSVPPCQIQAPCQMFWCWEVNRVTAKGGDKLGEKFQQCQVSFKWH